MTEATKPIEPQQIAIYITDGIYKSIVVTSAIALFILGCMAVAASFPGSASTLGWVTVGLSGSVIIMDFICCKTCRATTIWRINSLATCILLFVGFLGGMGRLSITQLGWAIIGTKLSQLVCTSHSWGL